VPLGASVVFCLGWPKWSIQITSAIQKKTGAAAAAAGTPSIPVEIQRLQCIISKQALANNTCWRLACVVGRSFSDWAIRFLVFSSTAAGLRKN
jgi:hypothetical protein